MSIDKINEIEKELLNEHRSELSKYIYFLISLSVSAIAFAIYKTSNSALTIHHTLVGIAVLNWGLSIFFGLEYIQLKLHSIFLNIEYYRVLKGENELTGQHPQAIEIGINSIISFLEDNNKKTKRYFSLQSNLFYSGILFYIVWHVFEMYSLAETIKTLPV